MRLIHKKIKRGMRFRASGTGRQPDERIFIVRRKTTKPLRVFMDAPAAFTKKDDWNGMVELEFSMEQIHRLLIPANQESGLFTK